MQDNLIRKQEVQSILGTSILKGVLIKADKLIIPNLSTLVQIQPRPYINFNVQKDFVSALLTHYSPVYTLKIIFRFNHVPKYRRSLFGAMKIVCRNLAGFMKSNGISEVNIPDVLLEEKKDIISAGIISLKKYGIEIK